MLDVFPIHRDRFIVFPSLIYFPGDNAAIIRSKRNAEKYPPAYRVFLNTGPPSTFHPIFKSRARESVLFRSLATSLRTTSFSNDKKLIAASIVNSPSLVERDSVTKWRGGQGHGLRGWKRIASHPLPPRDGPRKHRFMSAFLS